MLLCMKVAYAPHSDGASDCRFIAACLMSMLHKRRRKWAVGCVLYSLGVSVKMNVLCAAPPPRMPSHTPPQQVP